MRRSIFILALFTACDRPPASPPKREPTPESEVAQAKFVVGLRTKFEGPLTRTFDDHTRLEIDRWTVVMSAVEVHLCERSSLWSLFESQAWAHVSNSTTRLGTPSAEELTLGTGGARIIGEIAPPLGDYCAAYAVYTPADADVMNDTPFPDDVLIGHTAVISGTLARPNAVPEKFVWTWDQTRAVRIELDRIAMHEPTDHVQVLVNKQIDADLLADLDLAALELDPAAALMEAFFARVNLYTKPKP